jgi:hypothetical protein
MQMPVVGHPHIQSYRTDLQEKWRAPGRHVADRDIGTQQKQGQQQSAGP